MALFFLALAVLAFILGAWWGGRRARSRRPLAEEAESLPAGDAGDGTAAPADSAADGPADPAADAAPAASGPVTLADLIEQLKAPYEASGHPRELIGLPEFRAAVAMLADPAVPLERVVDGAVGAGSELAMVAAEALAARTDAGPATARMLDHLRFARVWTLVGILHFLAERADRPVLWDVLLQAPEWWSENPVVPEFVAAFADARVQAGDSPDAAAAIARRPGFRIQDVRALLARTHCAAAPRLREALDTWEHTRVDDAFLRQVGRLHTDADEAALDEPIVPHPALEEAVAAVLDDLATAPAKSVVLAGEPGTGKSVVARRVAATLRERGWTIFEATAADVLAGQTYMGELEKRVRELLEQIDVARRVVWFVPGFHELALAGRHRYSATSVLDLVIGAIESGRIVLLGESTPTAMERVLQQRPRLRFAVTVAKVEPLGADATLALARRVVEGEIAPAGFAVEGDVAADALELARNYLASASLPGSVIGLLRQTRQRQAAAGSRRFARDDVLGAVAAITGLPRAVLDEREGLDPAGAARPSSHAA